MIEDPNEITVEKIQTKILENLKYGKAGTSLLTLQESYFVFTNHDKVYTPEFAYRTHLLFNPEINAKEAFLAGFADGYRDGLHDGFNGHIRDTL